MTITREKLLRGGITAITAPLPREKRRSMRKWLRGRLEIAQFHDADFAVLSRAKSGRTWLRAMISRLYQLKYGQPENELLEFDNFHRRNPLVPKICFTHGHALGELYDRGTAKPGFFDKKIVVLVRHPCDVAVSEYFQSTRRASTHKRELYGVDSETPMFDFVMQGKLGIPTIIEYLNAWLRRMDTLPQAHLVRYEDMRAEPVTTLATMMEFLEQEYSHNEIAQAVDFASFEKLKQKERENYFHNSRLAPRNADDPDSYKVRRAKVGGYRDYFDAAQIAEMEAYLQRHLSPRYGYTVTDPAQAGLHIA